MNSIQSNSINLKNESEFSFVGVKELQFIDPQYDKLRTLFVWYPSQNQDGSILNLKGKKAAIILSHGYQGNPHQLYWMTEKLVKQGWIVLGMKHMDAYEDKIHVDHWQRAQDIQTMINVISSDDIGRCIDTDKMGIVGFSLGGTTAVWVAGGRSTRLETLTPPSGWASDEEFSRVDEALASLNKEKMSKSWRDDHIQAAFVIAPTWSWLFQEKELSEIAIPMRFVAGKYDEVVNSEKNAGFFARHIPNTSYKELECRHFTFSNTLEECRPYKEETANDAILFFKENLLNLN